MTTVQRAEPALAELGLTMSTAHALWAIDPDEPAPTMKVVAQRLRCNASSLTVRCDRLLRRGYITRAEDPANRRSRVLALTPAGRIARRAALDALGAACPLDILSEDDHQDLLAVLSRTLRGPDHAVTAGAEA